MNGWEFRRREEVCAALNGAAVAALFSEGCVHVAELRGWRLRAAGQTAAATQAGERRQRF